MKSVAHHKDKTSSLLAGGRESRRNQREKLVKTLSNAIEKTLGDFKEDISKKSQVEKILIFRKVVEKITYSKNSLEVLISLRDKTSSLLAGGGIGLSGRRAVGIRLARQNPTPPFESAGFDIRTGGADSSNTNSLNSLPQMIKLVTPHNLPDQRFIIKC